MRIYLAQHGKAKSEEEDPGKPLTDEGRQEAERVAKALKGKIKVSRIYCSKKLRAKQTAEIFAKALAPGTRVESIDGLAPLDPIDSALEMLEDGVMFVGHLPHLSKLASKLIVHDETDDVIKFSYGGVLCLVREEKSNWLVAWYETP